MPKNVSLVADWHKGDTMRYSVKKSVTQNNETTTINYTLFLQVVDSTMEGYRIKAVYSEKMLDHLIPDSVLDQKQLFLKEVMKVEQEFYYRTDPTGSFLGIENWQNLLEQNIEQAQRVYKVLGVEEGIIEPYMQLARSTFNQEEVEGKLYPEIPLLHEWLGSILSTKLQKYKIAFPTMVGPVAADGVLNVADYNSETGLCRIETCTVLNQKQLRKAIGQYCNLLADKMGTLLPKSSLKRLKIVMTDKKVFEYQTDPANPISVDYIRAIQVEDSGDGSKSEKIERFVICKID